MARTPEEMRANVERVLADTKLREELLEQAAVLLERCLRLPCADVLKLDIRLWQAAWAGEPKR